LFRLRVLLQVSLGLEEELIMHLAGTGLHKSSIVQKIALAQADAVKHKSKAVGQVDVITVASSPTIINPNGRYTI
jgi:hypothetical protein